MTAASDAGRARALIVYGPLRGGTTLLRLMIDGHPDLSCIGESDYLVDHLHREGDAWRYDAEAMAHSRIFRASGLVLRPGLDGRAALEDMLDQIGRDGQIPVLILHRGIAKAAGLLGYAPILRFTRDPRDAARSAIGMGWAGDVWHGAAEWIGTERAWQDFEGSGIAQPVMRMRYEDLVARPEESLAALCDLVGVPYHPGMLSYPETSTYAAPDASLAEQWRHKLSEREVALVEHRVGGLLDGSGYAPSGVPAVAPSPLDMARLRLGNRIAIWRRMVDRFGVVTPVARGVGRRLGIKPLERAAQRRIDAETAKYLK